MAEFFYNPYSLETAEKNNEPSQLEAGLAGVASGIIKIPEGFVSLGAELVDLGLDTNTAVEVERFFDEINPFEEIAEQKAAGKITEALTQVATFGVGGASIASRLASKAIKARKSGNYVELGKNPNLQPGIRKVNELNALSGKQKFAVGVLGGATGETFVADVEDIGTFGDEFGLPTELDRDELDSGREDAFRKLTNRLKFGSESILITPVVYGAGRVAKSLGQRGKEMMYSNSQLERFFDKIGSGLRARGQVPQEIFEAQRKEAGRQAVDTNRAKELVKEIDKEVTKLFPQADNVLTKSIGQKEKKDFLEKLNDSMFAGKLDEPMPLNASNDIIKIMEKKGASAEDIDNLFGAMNGARAKFTELINMSSNAPKDVATLRGLMGERVGAYLGNTYEIFNNQGILGYKAYKPTDEAFNKAAKLFKRYAAKKNNPITDQEAKFMVETVLESVPKSFKPGKIPDFQYIDLTLGATSPRVNKSFQRLVTKDINGQQVTEPIGPGSKIFNDLFGRIKDPRYSIYDGMTKLSSVARKNQLMEELYKDSKYIFSDERSAAKAMPNQEIVSLDDPKYLAPFFRSEYTVNPLTGQYTTKEIAESLRSSAGAVRAFAGALPGEQAGQVGKAGSWLYTNLFLFPKATSQIAKTVLSPTTHIRNFTTASLFSANNGIFFENPAVVKEALGEAVKTIQLGTRSPQANELYRELLELGVVNQNVRLGDLKGLMKDTGLTDLNINYDKALGALFNRLKKFQKGAEDAYTAEDDFWKITNYFVEKDRLAKAYAKAGVEVGEKALKEEAADIVRNTVPNYAYVSDMVKGLRRTPFGNFMSFPSEIFRTSANIVSRGLKEIRDPVTGSLNPVTSTNPLKAIGLKRLAGMATTTATVPSALVAGAQALSDVTDEELEAMREFLPEWSQNSTILPVRDEETGELKYIDYSQANPYDTVHRPISTLFRNIQQGVDDEEALITGFTEGMAQAFGEIADPFISESIYSEAIFDLTLRNGVTNDGRRLYTDQTPLGDKLSIAAQHVFETQIPFSAKQFNRLYLAGKEQADKAGRMYELDDELQGVLGFRAIKVDPLKSLSYDISGYQKGKRDARREFTGGASGVLKGGPVDPDDIVKQYIVANQALFDTQKDMARKVRAAETLGVETGELASTFKDRQISTREFSALNRGQFVPFYPSGDVLQKFQEIADEIGEDNPYLEVSDIINELRRDMYDLDLNETFDIKLEDYITPPEQQQPLPITPGPATNLTQPQQPVSQTGLTPTEQALLTEEEKAIRLRQRGFSS